jgi:hypothetical protein
LAQLERERPDDVAAIAKLLDKARPSRSISGGVDFGWLQRVGVKPLTEIERQAIAASRVYMTVIKVSGNNMGRGKQEALRGQTISFPQPDGPVQVAQAKKKFPCTDLGPRDGGAKQSSTASAASTLVAAEPLFDQFDQARRSAWYW